MRNNHGPLPAIIHMIALALLLLASCANPKLTSTPVRPTGVASTRTPPQHSGTPQAVPSLTPTRSTEPDLLLQLLPAGSSVIEATFVQMSNELDQLVVALLGYGRSPDQLSWDRIELAVLDLTKPPISSTVWTSGPTDGERAEALQMRDINGDGTAEVLSWQSTGAAGEMLYVLGLASGVPGWLRPSGGRFDGQDHFGEVGARLEDIDGDGALDILASYGPAATTTDVYCWDGARYVFRVTLQDK